ncbi:reticulon-2 [Eudromia elegans]
MGQLLGFAHCKESPSTASTTPDSTEGGAEDFPELPPAPEPPEEEEEEEEGEEGDEGGGARGGRGRELTFSYIAFGGGGGGEGPPRPRRDSLLRWRAPGRSARALALALAALAALARWSAVSVAAYGALAVLAVTVPRRLLRDARRALRPGTAQPPAPAPPSGLSAEQRLLWARSLGRHGAAAARTLTGLVLVQSLPRSLQFAFFFYLLTYVGAVFNGLTLLGIGVICAFTLPVLYERHQAQIERSVGLVRSRLGHLRARIQAKLPSAKAKPQ